MYSELNEDNLDTLFQASELRFGLFLFFFFVLPKDLKAFY